jgi:hypothetical protein
MVDKGSQHHSGLLTYKIMPRKAHASPTKEFFVHMITKDISLEACILDLLDNCIDGARDDLRRRGEERPETELFRGYKAEISFDRGHFEIRDNCGGIPIEDAVNYAFHFGRRPDAAAEAEHAIGLYGIGMKRAVFKIGRDILVSSSTDDEAFTVSVDVEEWLRKLKPIIDLDDVEEGGAFDDDLSNKTGSSEENRVVMVDDWDFPLQEEDPRNPSGTTVRVTALNPGIDDEFDDPLFEEDLDKTVARDYAFILQKGFEIYINDEPVAAYDIQFRSGGGIEPVNYREFDGDVEVRVIAGMAAPPEDDVTPEADPRFDPEYSGWYVLCNDRVVVAADKSERTGWGTPGVPRWHAQYNGFVGIVSFYSTNPGLLPWDTTKRNLERSNPRYRRALARMKQATRPFTDYTNLRKGALNQAKLIENSALPISVMQIREAPERREMRLPELPVAPRERLAVITYRKPPVQVDALKDALGDPELTQAEVGSRTFDYFYNKFVRG